MGFRFDLLEIHPLLKRVVEFTKEWFEKELRKYFYANKLMCKKYDVYPISYYKDHRHRIPSKAKDINPPFDNVNIVFLAGGTCRIPFVQKWVGDQFPKAKVIIDGELEIITATGAVIHALQVLNGEIEPYFKPIGHLNNNHDFKEK